MNFDISAGMKSALTDEGRDDLAGELAAQATAAGDGYVLAAATLLQAAASILAVHMPPAAAVKMIRDLSDLTAQTVQERLCPVVRQ